jgi:hypothetical protein
MAEIERLFASDVHQCFTSGLGAVDITNLNSTETKATRANSLEATETSNGFGNFGGNDSVLTRSAFTYDGVLNFRVEGTQNAGLTIGHRFATGGANITDFADLGFKFSKVSGLQLSRSSFSNGTAVTTFVGFRSSLRQLRASRSFTMTASQSSTIKSKPASIVDRLAK